MISMLILTLVCVAWLEIIGIQSAKKEARRREAVERLVGMMDAFMYLNRTNKVSKVELSFYRSVMMTNAMGLVEVRFPKGNSSEIYPMFGDVTSIGYQLHVVQKGSLPNQASFVKWAGSSRWLIGRLYDRNGTITDMDEPFFTLPVCLGL